VSGEEWPAGPIVLGVGWEFSDRTVRMAASLAAATGLHLVCAFVDPASYLTEWAPAGAQPAVSLDPVANEEAAYPAERLLRRLEAVLGPPGAEWSFRVLNGDIAVSLTRLAESVGASLVVVGGQRPGVRAWLDRHLEGSVSAQLTRNQHRPVLVIPCPA
jgi:nucleotide-binding universal stress UspA family protein